jgi:hypothetical protein
MIAEAKRLRKRVRKANISRMRMVKRWKGKPGRTSISVRFILRSFFIASG